LFKDAKKRFERANVGGDKYTLAHHGYQEFIRWFDMPWECTGEQVWEAGC
jgi:hypothetical protein